MAVPPVRHDASALHWMLSPGMERAQWHLRKLERTKAHKSKDIMLLKQRGIQGGGLQQGGVLFIYLFIIYGYCTVLLTLGWMVHTILICHFVIEKRRTKYGL